MKELTPLQFKVINKLAALEGEWRCLQGGESMTAGKLCSPFYAGGPRYVRRQPHAGNPSRTEYRLTVEGRSRLRFEMKRRSKQP